MGLSQLTERAPRPLRIAAVHGTESAPHQVSATRGDDTEKAIAFLKRNIYYDLMIDASTVLDAVGEPNRRYLLELLRRRSEATVSELVTASGLRQPQVSKHLKVLSAASLVSARADGRRRHYRLDGHGLQLAHDWFASFEDVWTARLDTLDHLVSTDHSQAEEPTP